MVAIMVEMGRRPTTPEEDDRFLAAVRELAWQHARTLADLEPGQPPWSPFGPETLSAGERIAAGLALLGALRDVRDTAARLIDRTTITVGHVGASGPAIGAVLGVTGAAVRKRWPDAVSERPGPRKPEPLTLDEREQRWENELNELHRSVAQARAANVRMDDVIADRAEQNLAAGLPIPELARQILDERRGGVDGTDNKENEQ